MIFKLNKLITNEKYLLDSLKHKQFVTYANVNSFRVGGNFRNEYNFYADGKPVALLFSLLIGRRVKRLTALSIDSFWVNVLKGYRVIIVGYEDKLEGILMAKNIASEIKIDHIIHGYYSLEILKQGIEDILVVEEVPTIIFLGIGQPNQEKLLSMLNAWNGKVSIVCVGAYFKQRVKLNNEFFPFMDSLGLTPIIRFWNKPLTLLKRTFYALLFVPFRIRS